MKNKILKIIVCSGFIFVVSVAYNLAIEAKDTHNIVYEDVDFDDAIIIQGITIPPHQPTTKISHKKTVIKKKSGKLKVKHVSRKKIDFSILKLRKKDLRWHYTEYKVRKNDNLWNIAENFGTLPSHIIKANKISAPDTLKTGIILKIPNRNGIWYKINKSDTLELISNKYTPEWAEKITGIKAKEIYAMAREFAASAH